MRTAYRNVLRRGDVLSALVPYVLARLPLTMAPLALLLLVQQQSGSYHRAGIVCGAYAVAGAFAAPLLGRFVDRYGQGPVLLATGATHPIAAIGAAALAESGHYALLVAAAVVAGVSLPPVSACMRVLWSRLLPDDGARQVGFAIEGIIVEVAELGGPLLVSLLLVLGRPAVAVGAAGVLMGAAALAFRLSGASRDVPVEPTQRSPWGALAFIGVRRLLLIVAASTATIGAVEVDVTAYARHHGGLSAAGLYIAVISAGGIVAGFLFGGVKRAGRNGAPVLFGVLLVSGAAAAALSLSAAPALVLGALFLFGAAIAVGVIVQLATMSTVVNESLRTEAYTWGATANFVGLGFGTALAGWAIDRDGLHSAFVVSAVPIVFAAAVALASRYALTGVGVHFEPVQPEATELPPVATAAASVPEVDVSGLAEEVAALRTRVIELQAALAAALDAPATAVDDAQDRARRMLDRADAACLEMRQRADDDAERVRSAATTASLEILAAADRDARALLDRARREADGILDRARRTAGGSAEAPRPPLHALPAIDVVAADDEAAAGS